MQDFNQYKINPLRMYGGANGNKIAIIINDENYMLKFPSKAEHNSIMSYSNSPITEHLGCQIGRLLGFNVQETMIGTYSDKTVVACKDFEQDGYRLQEFALLKNTIITSEQDGYGTELDDILHTINEQKLLDPYDLEKHFWDMFALDSLIGNFDRHNGNWGLLINEELGDVKLAPIYDCGSCLFPQNTEKNMKQILDDKQALNIRSNSRPTSAIRRNGVRINYFDFIKNTDNLLCLESINTLQENYDYSRIVDCIDHTPGITDTHKTFYKEIIKLRKDRLIDRGMEQNLTWENHEEINTRNLLDDLEG